ncbi:MAG: alpha/beta fold hydrolase [Alphaproteobacteria bacterium]
MQHLWFDADESNGIAYEAVAPAHDRAVTFVFLNPLLGDLGDWTAAVAPRVRDHGHGWIAFNWRGQQGSAYSPDLRLDGQRMMEDARLVLSRLAPRRVVPVGLGIGGAVASRLILAGTPALGMVLINGLRATGLRLQAINDALVRALEIGGLPLLLDLYTPFMAGEAWLAEHLIDAFGHGRPAPLSRATGLYNLMVHAGVADWDQPYENLALPTLVATGLADRLFNDPAVVAEKAARLQHGRRLDFPDAGLMIPREAPEELAAALIGFARDLR